jgi:hypothetical protein
MEAMCRRALKIGLPALAFTEHLDLTGWVIDPEDLLDHLRPPVGDNVLLIPEPLDVAGYLESVWAVSTTVSGVAILSGVEFGQPHIDADKARQLVDLSALDRVNGSLHTAAKGCFSATARQVHSTLWCWRESNVATVTASWPVSVDVEIPLGIVLVILMVLVCGVHLGRGIANVLAGAGQAFPTRVELFRSLPAVLGGDAAAGLDGLNGSVSSPSAVWMWGHRDGGDAAGFT